MILHTVLHWNVKVNSAFFMGGDSKNDVLTAFKAYIYFDDQDLRLVSSSAPAARVPYRTEADQKCGEP